MNYLRAIIALLILSPVIVAGPPKRLAFGNMKFQHAWEEKKQIVTNEYVELGQTLENWQHMLAYRQYPGYTKPATIINAYFRQIKPTETPAIYRKDESGNDMIFVFLMEAPDKSYMEFNIHRFTLESGMVRSYQFAARNLRRDYDQLTSDIKNNRKFWIESVAKLNARSFEQ